MLGASRPNSLVGFCVILRLTGRAEFATGKELPMVRVISASTSL